MPALRAAPAIACASSMLSCASRRCASRAPGARCARPAAWTTAVAPSNARASASARRSCRSPTKRMPGPVACRSSRTQPSKARPSAANAAHSAEPMKPAAPVTITRPRGAGALEPAPAMLAVEAPAAAHEPAHVREALGGRVATVMHDLHRGHVGRAGDLVEAHAPVEVLEIEEEARIEPARAVDGVAAHEHEGTGQR